MSTTTTSFSLGSDFRLGFHLTLNSTTEEGKAFKVAALSPRATSPGALSVTSSPALPTESAGKAQESPDPVPGAPEDPLAQLQNALEKTGFLGSKLLSPAPTPAAATAGPPTTADRHLVPPTPPGTVDPYRCHLCKFVAASKFQYNAHLNSHFDHKCPFCDYTSRTEGRLKRHVKDFHSEAPAEGWGGGGVLSAEDEAGGAAGEPAKPRRHRCKQCDFVALTKSEFWEHSKTHIKAEKLLTCPKCPFVTEYKHHLEYHLRNHFGSKPFKCNKCNYSCVNKSMLNSHMKSHSNVYQYRCCDCTYATKYCHSLKLHLRKYNHKPASVLNSDGSLNPLPIIDVYGTRRGPRPKKEPGKPGPMQIGPYGGLPGPLPFLCTPPHLLGSYGGPVFPHPPNFPGITDMTLSCTYCEFIADRQDVLMKHLMDHAHENRDLCSLYGINPQLLTQDQPSPQRLAILPPPPEPIVDGEPSPAISPGSQQSSPGINPGPENVEPHPEDEKPDTTPLDLSHPREQQQQHKTRNRRKGKAFKLNRIIRFQEETEDEFMSEDSCTLREDSEDGQAMKEEEAMKLSPGHDRNQSLSPGSKQDESGSPGLVVEPDWHGEETEAYVCHYCDISFKDCVMYTVHMGYHGYRNPFKCNMCGQESKDKVAFFLHMARAAHH